MQMARRLLGRQPGRGHIRCGCSFSSSPSGGGTAEAAAAAAADSRRVPRFASFRTSFEHSQASTINWFPGHMASATRELRETLRHIDLVLEVRDARVRSAIPTRYRLPVAAV
jgi:hypothetical protein